MNVRCPHVNTTDGSAINTQDKTVNRALIVDDDWIMLRLMEKMLARLGYHTHATSNAELALSLHRNGAYDLVVTDLIMPSLPGNELADRIKTIDRETLVIIITGKRPTEVSELVEQCLADCWMHKPINYDDLQEILDRIQFNPPIRNTPEPQSPAVDI